MLRVESISAGYGGVPVLTDVFLEVHAGEIVALVGSNGAGKSTLLRAISNLIPITKGAVWFGDKRIDRLPSHEIVELGLAHVLENRHIFGRLSVLDNLLLGAYTRRSSEDINATLRMVYDMFPVLEERSKQKSETLSGGERQMLATARGLMCKPTLLMLDEPSLGLMPLYVQTVLDAVSAISKQGVTVLLVEQQVRRALEIADRAYVLQDGHIVLEGDADDLLESELVRKAYLGM